MKKNNSPESGSTLVLVMTLLFIIMVTVAIAVEYTTAENRNVQRTTAFQNAMAVGDSAVEVLFNGWRAGCRSNVNKVFTTVDFAAGGSAALPTPSPFPGCSPSNFVKRGTNLDPASSADYDPTYTVSNYKVVAVDAEYNPLATTAATPEPQLGQLKAALSGTPTPRTPATWNYIASADVTLPVSFGSGNVNAKVRRVFSKKQESPWNYAIFFVDPLEIHPGPLFTVTGWVNTNSNLYTGHSSLTFADKVTYAGDWFESTSTNLGAGFMPGDTYHLDNDPANGSPTYPSNLPPARGQALQPLGLDSTLIFNSSDTNPNNDSYHELIEPPQTGYTDPLAGTRLWDQAAIVIEDNGPSGNTKGWDNANGHDQIKIYTVDPNTGAKTQITSGSIYSMIDNTGFITTNQVIQDNREGKGVSVTTLDLSQILQTSSGVTTYQSSIFASNPIIYFYDTTNSATNRKALRIKKGSTIPSAGLTVVSNGPVYLQGDFNTGGTGTAVPTNNPSNLNTDGTYLNPSNPPNPQVNGYTRAPCSIIADAVDILSSTFSDSETGPLTAAATTVNAAIISGIVPTNVQWRRRKLSAFPGGLEQQNADLLRLNGGALSEQVRDW
jgi:hypothetical protein